MHWGRFSVQEDEGRSVLRGDSEPPQRGQVIDSPVAPRLQNGFDALEPDAGDAQQLAFFGAIDFEGAFDQVTACPFLFWIRFERQVV